jgi:predicted permease
MATFLLLVAIGMKIPKRQKPIPKPILAAFLGIRLLLIPAFSLGIALLAGLHLLPDNTAFLVALILSFMPTAFISLVPPSLYGLDFELSFGLWLVSNLSLAGILPLLWFLTTRI